MSEQNMNQQDQIQEAVSQAVRDAMREFVSNMPQATGDGANVDKLIDAMNDMQSRLDQQNENSLRLAKEFETGENGVPMALDFIAIKDNVSEFKNSIELCNQTMDQLRKQLNRERNNNDRTITELYRSMKYSEERIEELHANYDEFTTVIQSHKSVMGILVWLNVIVIAALIILSVLMVMTTL